MSNENRLVLVHIGSMLVAPSVGNPISPVGNYCRSNYVMSAEYTISVMYKMSKRIIGSLDLTVLLENAKKGHSAFKRGNNGHIYVNITAWQNEEKDKYGNDFSIQLSSTKEKAEAEKAANNGKSLYIGNMKYPEQQEEKPLEQNAPEVNLADSDLPF